MTFQLLRTKPLPEPVLIYCESHIKESRCSFTWNSNALIQEMQLKIWKCRLLNIAISFRILFIRHQAWRKLLKCKFRMKSFQCEMIAG